MQEVLRICDRYLSSYDKRGQLNQFLVLVSVFHLIMGIAFVKMEDYQRKHPRVIREVEVSFLQYVAAPNIETNLLPKPISLTPGENPDPGSEASGKARATEKKLLPTAQAIEQFETAKLDQTEKSNYSHELAGQIPPLAITPVTPVKLMPAQLHKSQADAQKDLLLIAPPLSQGSGAPIASGSTDDSTENGRGSKSGYGNDGSGKADGTKGSGTDEFNQGDEEKISTDVKDGLVAKGNITPYKRAVLFQLGHSWKPKHKGKPLTVRFTIAKDGVVLSAEISESSGNPRLDREAIETVESMQFPSLPDWYRGEQMIFQIDLAQ